MLKVPEEFSAQISSFCCLFSNKVFEHAKLLLMGSILAIGRRTVCSSLRALGLSEEKRFHKYHRVLNLSKWSSFKGSRILLDLLVSRLCKGEEPLVFGIDETLERRWGQKIAARGIYRDSVRSSKSHFVKSSGLRWICLMLLSPVSWAERVWALPFLTVLAPSERYYKDLPRGHKKLTDWARQMILQLKRWLPERQIVVVADSSYAVYRLLDAVRGQVCMITPLRLDARLFDWPPSQRASKRGAKPKIGKRQLPFKQVLADTQTAWIRVCIPKWYGQSNKKMDILTGTALWYKSNDPIVPLRWVLLKDPAGKLAPKALLATDLELSALQIINYFIRRWTVEVTFEETRKHLGVESQRQWSDVAITRTTPVLMATFSIITLWADKLNQQGKIRPKPTAWYKKKTPTFADAIAAVRMEIWNEQKYLTSTQNPEVNNLSPHFLKHLINMATRAA